MKTTSSILLILCLLLGCCSHAPSAQDQADMIRIGAAMDKACEAAALTPEECTAGKEALVRLGVSLQQVERARVMAEAWDVARPIITAGIGWLLAGGA